MVENKKELLNELKKKFEEIKKDLGFEPNFEDIEREFHISDGILSTGFVSENFSRQLCSRIVDYFRDWHGYLNSLLMPNPSYFAGQTESKLFQSKEDRDKIWDLIKVSMNFSSMYSLVGLEKNKAKEAKFINESYESWTKTFKPGIVYILTKVNNGWRE